MDFLSPDNACGQSLLILVARGSAILAEVQRLSENIPKIITSKAQEYKKYEKILFDFEYLKNIDVLEDEIQRNQDINELDENFKKSYLPLVERFYRLFESIYLYYSDLMAFIQELEEAVFMQYSVETVLQDPEGKRLFAESFYLYGCMLLLMDILIPGKAREKLIISYYRYKGGQTAIEFINEVTKLCAETGYTKNGTRPAFYPEEYMARFQLPEKLITEVINSIKDEDIYKFTSIYPSADHRSIALSVQGSMLYVLLFFTPTILNNKKSKMREIVDKHFYDQWVISFYLGYFVDLSEQWNPYPAAREAIKNTINFDYIQELGAFYQTKLTEQINKVQEYLYEGQMTQEFVLDKISSLMNCVRESNIAIRWILLHSNTSISKARDLLNKIDKQEVLQLLLQSSKFENRLLKAIKAIIDNKQQYWDEDKVKCVERMQELADYFSGKALGKVKADESYMQWFTEMGNQIQSLNYSDSTHAGRKIQRLIQALEDIEQYPQISTSIQVKHYLNETRKDLTHMVKIVHIKSTLPSHISYIADFSYSWQCLKGYKDLMQAKVQSNPHSALSLKTTFQKLSSILNTPTIRIIQAGSPDLNSVTKYYSGELVKFVKEVLQIIPIQVFEVLQDIITLITSVLKPLPSRINKIELKDYAQYEDRTQIAKLTNSISVFTESILTVDPYLLGSIEVNPREMLDQGIRKELMALIHKILDSQLIFPKKDISDFQSKLSKLGEEINGFKLAMEQIQDFVNAKGLKMFTEEFNRLIECYTSMELKGLITGNKEYEELSYDEDIPMPDEKSKQYGAINFIGRLLNQIILITNPREIVFVESTLGFYDSNGRDVLNLKTIGLILKCIGVSGLNGIDLLLSQHLSKTVKDIVKILKADLNQENRNTIDTLIKQVRLFTNYDENYDKVYKQLTKQFRPLISKILYPLQQIGQFINLRKLICLVLQMKAKVGSTKLFLCLETLNNTIINDFINRQYDSSMESDIKTQMENNLLFDLTKLFNYVGLSDPIRKIYALCEMPEHTPLILALVVLHQLPLMDFDQKLNCLVKKAKDNQLQYEPNCLLMGIIGFLNQFNQLHSSLFVSYLGFYIKSTIFFMLQSKELQKQPEILGDFFMLLTVIEEIFRIREDNYENFKQLIPFGLFNYLKREMIKW
ncbi:unnamed protein product [Paramecium pentaurelia]|uniref:Uncharacterized protein n=1 Tax=Paramecium pentaurelia TaxID=43138 RepID=A0A8S1T825_9CILI|nr:unnamed protein product [Paramecium pentaurelia]